MHEFLTLFQARIEQQIFEQARFYQTIMSAKLAQKQKLASQLSELKSKIDSLKNRIKQAELECSGLQGRQEMREGPRLESKKFRPEPIRSDIDTKGEQSDKSVDFWLKSGRDNSRLSERDWELIPRAQPRGRRRKVADSSLFSKQ